jgi:putative component of toxin-antitoxin plasmid stabilization module
MAKFSLELMDSIQGKQRFYKLRQNDICPFDDFQTEIENGNYLSELLTIYAYIEMVSNLKTLPNTKFRDTTPAKSPVKEYEIKSKHLRVYLFHEEKTGKVVVCGGQKTAQKSDIKRFRNLIKAYLKSQ